MVLEEYERLAVDQFLDEDKSKVSQIYDKRMSSNDSYIVSIAYLFIMFVKIKLTNLLMKQYVYCIF